MATYPPYGGLRKRSATRRRRANPPRKMYTVYILQSEKDRKRYIGLTGNLDRRLYDHENGLVKSTKNRRPLKLIYKEKYSLKSEAQKREKFFKSGKGREYLKKILND